MKFAVTLLTAAVGFLGVAAHEGHDHGLTLAGNVPECSVKCLQNAFTLETDCGSNDVSCMCKESNYKIGYAVAVNCVLQACGAEAAVEEVLPAVAELCARAIPGAVEDAIESAIISEIGLPAVPTGSNSVLILAPTATAATLATSVTGTAVVATVAEEAAGATASSTANSSAGRVAASLLGVAGLAVAFL